MWMQMRLVTQTLSAASAAGFQDPCLQFESLAPNGACCQGWLPSVTDIGAVASTYNRGDSAGSGTMPDSAAVCDDGSRDQNVL